MTVSNKVTHKNSSSLTHIQLHTVTLQFKVENQEGEEEEGEDIRDACKIEKETVSFGR